MSKYISPGIVLDLSSQGRREGMPTLQEINQVLEMRGCPIQVEAGDSMHMVTLAMWDWLARETL